MPPVRKPKPNKIPKPAVAAAKPELKKNVVSGQLKKRLPKEKPAGKERPQRGVVFIKHLPHGFFEQQLRQYFRQFGHVTRVRLARSERTGGSKGFAFVEFAYPEVAKVAADTMDNYLMFQKVVKASYIPPEKQKFNYFKNTVKKVTNKAGKEIYVSAVTKATQRSVQKLNNWNETTCQKRTVAGIKKLKKLQQKYEHLGIDFHETLVEPVKKSQQAAKKTTEKAKKELELEDLLGNTINEDSDDEDYVDEDEDMAEPSSAEEEQEDEVESEDEPAPIVAKKSQKKKQNTAEERMAELLKRKPGNNKVQKKKKDAVKATKSNKKTLQLEAAKQLAKPLKKAAKKLKQK